MTIRPWGLHSWILPKITVTDWSFLGCIAPEERSLASLREVTQYRQVKLLEILDPPSYYSQDIAQKLKIRRDELVSRGGKAEWIETRQLFERTEQLVKSTTAFISGAGENLIVDITSLPKRFFFPILKIVLQTTTLRNVLVTYTVPASYPSTALAENPEAWRHIPLFAPPFPEPKVDLLFVGLGFETLGLPDLLEHEYHDISWRLFFPVPPGPPAYQRTWEFLRKVEKTTSPKRNREPVRVDAKDASEAYNHILASTDHGRRYALFAPYGPKPISLAMCLYAAQKNCPVYYTQPKTYNPNYSEGVRLVDGVPEIYAYCIRLDGRSLYPV